MIDIVKALLLGAAVGAVFALFRLQPPAPATWAGVAGIVGIVAAWWLVSHLLTPTI